MSVCEDNSLTITLPAPAWGYRDVCSLEFAWPTATWVGGLRFSRGAKCSQTEHLFWTMPTSAMFETLLSARRATGPRTGRHGYQHCM
jgi:hypothetical protein